ncbi:unnamed protein product [Cylindrotheca closterium]|uniref:Uncharacterized protein n=1 Tax=Cylindrotheca closterium TaxID=2856 RepID=A0AAD2PXN9_9STRA|nr:unnamed protein product [Cylindrotheca closterium]
MKIHSLFAALPLSLWFAVGANAQNRWDFDQQPSKALPEIVAPPDGLHYEEKPSQDANQGENQVYPVFDYRFSCDVVGLPRIHDEASSQSIVGEDWIGLDLSTHCHYDHNGVSSQHLLESENSIATLRQWFLATNATGFSLEVWMTPTVRDNLSVAVPILAIGGDHSVADQSSYDEDGNFDSNECHDTTLYVGLRSNLVEVRYVDNDSEQSCRVLLVDKRPLENDEPVQIALTMNNREANVYINGELALSITTNHDLITNMKTWDTDDKLKLFSDQTDTSTRITLHQVSLYGQLIEAKQIQWGYQQELIGKQETLLEHEPARLVIVEKAATVIQGTASPFEIGGKAKSTSDYVVAIEILSLPPDGTILDDDGPITEIGTRIRLPKASKKTDLMYRANSDEYFTSPNVSYSGRDLGLSSDVFVFRLVALDRDNGSLVGWSDKVKKEITIQHVNQPATLVLPKAAKLAEVPDFNKIGPIASIDEVHLQDPDLNVDLVRVDIWAYNGTITIQDHVELANFEFTSTSSEISWHSHGTPSESQNMTFVAEPDDASLILSSIQYQGFRWGQEDRIVIRIYDGVGGPCLNRADRKYKSVNDDCFHIMANVFVPAVTWIPTTLSFESDESFRFNIWVALVLILFGCSCAVLVVQMGGQQLLRMRNWKERDSENVEQVTSSDKEPELDMVDFD